MAGDLALWVLLVRLCSAVALRLSELTSGLVGRPPGVPDTVRDGSFADFCPLPCTAHNNFYLVRLGKDHVSKSSPMTCRTSCPPV